MSVFPELVTGRDDVTSATRWRVREGTALRGGASCDLVHREIEVPLGDDPASRVVRAHELMHVRISPIDTSFVNSLFDVSARALECVEEFRVNALLSRRGFDVSVLRDGTEKPGAVHLAREGRWDEAACFAFAVLGTGAEREFLAGLRRERPEWMPGIHLLRRRARSHIAKLSDAELGSTRLNSQGIPEGYARVTIVLARAVTQAMHAGAPLGPDSLASLRRSLTPGARRVATGRFASLVLAPDATLPSRRAMVARRRRPATTGTSLAFPGRLLTDERRRGFAHPARARGGVVLVDLSGSMDVKEEELARLLVRWPHCVVLGYSHRPGDVGTTPNLWVLAAGGRVRALGPLGNVGNGVDGPALEFALSLRERGEVLVFVTDGQVTDSHDHPGEALAAEVASLVARSKVRLVRGLADVPRALRASSWRNEWASFGRLGRQYLINR